jgi:oxaloacetate decarboxylase gamma subunit
MQGGIIEQGIELMLYGMGTVVIFLAMLVLATTGMSGLITRYFPEPEPVASRTRTADEPTGARELDPALVAAIMAAIHRHRKTDD